MKTQENLPKYLEKLKMFHNMHGCIAIIDMGFQNNRDSVETLGFTYFHSPGVKEKLESFNVLLDENSKTENDVLLVDESLLLSLPVDTSFFQEMRDILYYTEKHAFISPRIDTYDDPVYYGEYLKLLPWFSILSEPDIRCVIIKKKVIDILIHFDNSYSSFYYFFKDFIQRANCYGFSAVRSNYNLIHDPGNFLNDRDNNTEDENIFLNRFPYYYWVMKNYYNAYEKHPMDRFLVLFSKKYAKKKILLNYHIMPCLYCGTSEYQLAFADAFYRLFHDKYEIYIYTNRPADNFHRLSEKYPNVLFHDTISGVFDLGFCAHQPFRMEDHVFLNQYCLKSVYSMLDIIMLRCNYVINEHPNNTNLDSVVRFGFQVCDGIISISDNSTEDYKAYYISDTLIKDKPVKRVYIASNFVSSEEKSYDLPFDTYFLITGNHYRHKAVVEAIHVVSNTPHNYIAIVGNLKAGYINGNVYGYTSGQLNEDFINYLYANCQAVIFPSLYEGFGLPVAISLKNKKRIIMYNCMLNKELYQHFHEFKDYFYFFDKFSQICGIIESMDFSDAPAAAEYKDTWENTAIEIESFFDEILKTKINVKELLDRWHLFNLFGVKAVEYGSLAAEYDGLAAERDMIAAERDKIAAQRDLYTAERIELTAERDKLVYERNAISAERDGFLGSRSWRFTKPLRNLGSFVRRHKILRFLAKGLLSIKKSVFKHA